jgi:hypothetical protein
MEELPEWKGSITVPIYKTVAIRGISLVSTTYKTPSNIMLSRLVHMHRKLLEINVDIDNRSTAVICPTFIRYLRKNGNKVN